MGTGLVVYCHCSLFCPGFDGKGNLSQARADMIVGCIEDLTAHVDEVFFAKEEEVKVREKRFSFLMNFTFLAHVKERETDRHRQSDS